MSLVSQWVLDQSHWNTDKQTHYDQLKGLFASKTSHLEYAVWCRCIDCIIDQAYPGGGGSPWLVECKGEWWSTTGAGAGEASCPSTAAAWGGVEIEAAAEEEEEAVAGGGTCAWAGVEGTLVEEGWVILASSGSCCLECRGLTNWGRGGGGAEFWTCLRTCLVYPVSFLKLFTACMKKEQKKRSAVFSNLI